MTAEYASTWHGVRVALRCDARLADQARALLQSLAPRFDASPPAAGMRIRFAGFELTLVSDGEGLVLHGPPLDDGPPADLGALLSIVAAQLALARRVGAGPVEVHETQWVVVGRGALRATALQALRAEPQDGDDSGWSLDDARSPAGGGDADAYEAMTVLQLLQQRRALGPALVLPPGWSVVVDGERIVAVFDPDGHDRLGVTR